MIGSRPHFKDQDGFTLIELLVVILIMVILTTARTSFATYYLNEGTYVATTGDLIAIEPALGDAINFTVTGTATTWEASALSRSGTTFSIRFDGTNQYE